MSVGRARFTDLFPVSMPVIAMAHFPALPGTPFIAGPMAGAEPDASVVAEAKEAVGDKVPVLMNTGAKVENIGRFLQVADGVIVGSGLKLDGQTWNPVDPVRITASMEAVRAARGARA